MLVSEFEGALLPATFCATTEQEYAMPLVNPETASGELAALPVMPPGLQVAK